MSILRGLLIDFFHLGIFQRSTYQRDGWFWWRPAMARVMTPDTVCHPRFTKEWVPKTILFLFISWHLFFVVLRYRTSVLSIHLISYQGFSVRIFSLNPLSFHTPLNLRGKSHVSSEEGNAEPWREVNPHQMDRWLPREWYSFIKRECLHLWRFRILCFILSSSVFPFPSSFCPFNPAVKPRTQKTRLSASNVYFGGIFEFVNA